MRCPSCNHDTRAAAKFCEECGQVLNAEEGSAGASPSERSPRSYTPPHLADKILQSKSALAGERKQVTALFADVKGSMEMAEQMDPEAWSAIMQRFLSIVADGIHRFEGMVNQYMGDGVMALFGAPIAHEDHAQRACYAALHLRAAVREYASEVRIRHGVPFAVRIGLNSGEVVVSRIGDDLRMDYTAQGQVVGLAQRMQAIAESGHIFISEHTARLVEGYFQLQDLGRAKVKGVSEPVGIFDLDGTGSLRTRLDRSRARGLSRFVGRDPDMAILEAALERARSGSGQVVGVVAEPGTGKSRLCAEFLAGCRARGIPILEARGVAHGKLIPMLPMLELWRAVCGITDGDDPAATRAKITARLLPVDRSLRAVLPFLFDVLGVSDPVHPAPTIDAAQRQTVLHDAVKRVLHDPAYGATRVLLLEDLHWFDGASDSFLATMVESVPATRDLLLVNFRPEYQASWMQRAHYQEVPLQPLGPEAIRALLRDQLGEDPSVAALPAIIHERTKGNPFFIEEVVQSLVESGHLVGTRGAYQLTTAVDALEVPVSVHAVLAARIDRLPERDKHVLQTAAVIGKTFGEALLHRVMASVAPIDDAELGAALAALAAAEFLFEAAVYPQREYSFKHPLTREVAQRSQLRERRIRVHVEAAAQARARFAYGETHLHLEAALDLLGEQPETRERLRQEMALLENLGTTLFGMRGYGDADGARAFARMRELAERLDGAEASLQAMEGQLIVHTMRAEYTSARDRGEELLVLAEQLGNYAAIARALPSLGGTLIHLGEVEDAHAHAERGRALCGQHEPTIHGIACCNLLASTHAHLGHIAQARAMNREAVALAAQGGIPYLRAHAANFAATVCAALRDVAETRSLAEETERLATEYGFEVLRITATIFLGWCTVAEGRVDEGLPVVRDGLAEYATTGQRISTTSYCLPLIEAHLARGDWAAANQVLDTAFAFVAETGERIYEHELYRLKGECALVANGRHAVAVQHFERAIAIAAANKALLFELRAATSLCRVEPSSARARLAGLVERFSPEDDCADLRAAQALLAT